MFGSFYPKKCVDSTYEIDFKALYKQGYRGVLFDIDNTLVPHGKPADKRARELFDRLRKIGFHTCLISNNKEPRVKPFAEEVRSEYIFDAHKPSVKNYRKAMELMGTDKNTTLFLGDQFTVCRRPAFYGCLWSKQSRYVYNSGKADSSKGRNTDCIEKVFRENCFVGI